MTQRRNDTPANRLTREPRIAPVQAEQRCAQPLSAGTVSTRRWNISRDVVAGVLLLIAPLFPWNVYFGATVPHSSGAVFALLAVATALSFVAIAASYAGHRMLFGSHFDHPLAGRLRLALNAPYALLILGFVAFDVVQTVRYGGTVKVPGGVGPGAWLGIAGSALSAQPLIAGTAVDDSRFRRWLWSVRFLGYASIVLAALSVSFNLFWRIKAAAPSSTSSSGGLGKPHLAIMATAVVYGIVALAAVVVPSRWILRPGRSSGLATVALGASTLAAGSIVWLLPVGREIDAFHGIAQNTSTAGVGFEGYLFWVAAAAVFAPLTLLRATATHQIEMGIWRAAARKGLLLISLWCLASVVMRVTDIAVAAILNLPHSPYNSAAMAAFDLVTAVLAMWLRVNLTNRSLPVVVISSLCGVLFVLAISRIVVGIALAPRIAGTPAEAGNPVYGNNFAQQITSTFDVVLCGLALCILAVAVLTARHLQRRTRSGGAMQPAAARPQPAQSLPIHRREDATQQLAAGKPRIFRPHATRRMASDESAQPSAAGRPRIYRPPENSTGQARPRD